VHAALLQLIKIIDVALHQFIVAVIYVAVHQLPIDVAFHQLIIDGLLPRTKV
jgi:hypothetical protein